VCFIFLFLCLFVFGDDWCCLCLLLLCVVGVVVGVVVVVVVCCYLFVCLFVCFVEPFMSRLKCVERLSCCVSSLNFLSSIRKIFKVLISVSMRWTKAMPLD